MLYDIPGAHRHPVHAPTRSRARRAPAHRRRQGRQGRPVGVHQGHGRDRPALVLRRRRRSTSPLLAQRRHGVVSASSATSPASSMPRWSPPSTAATSREARRIHRLLIPVVDAHHDHLPGRHHGQGRAASSSGSSSPPPCGCRWSSHRPSTSTLLRSGSRDAPDPSEPPPPRARPAPAPLADGGVRVVALGGLGEVGRNMAVLEHRGQLLVIDCGVLFPEDHHPGVDLILPDFEYIEDRLDDVQAVVLTHGHEDHIGAVPYLLRLKPDIPLVGSTLTLALVEAKLKEHRITPYTLGVREGDAREARRLRLRVRRGQPLDPRRARRRRAHPRRHAAAHRRLQDGPAAARRPAHRPARLRAAGGGGRRPLPDRLDQRRGARASPRPSGTSPRRSTRCSGTRERRIIVACFSSHVHRVQQVLDAAEKAGRKVAMVGRSMVRNMGIAADLGYLHVPDGVLVDVKKLDDLPDDQIVLICTGSPGRADGGAVADGQPRPPHRRRRRRHRAAGVVADPRQRERRLPGHQRPDAARRQRRAQGQRQGARLRPRQRRRAPLLLQHRQAPQRHAGARRVAPPRRQRRARGRRPACRATRSCSPRTASSSTSSTAGPRIVGAVPCGYVYVDGSSVGEFDEALLKDRRILRDEGFISVIVVIDSATGKVVGRPGDPRARVRRGRRDLRRGACPKIEQALDGGHRQAASPTPTSSSRSCAGPWAAGSAARSAAAR